VSPGRTNPPASNSIVGHFLHPPTEVRVLPGDVGHSELRHLGDALPEFDRKPRLTRRVPVLMRSRPPP
jgi:hypothetical protein